MDENTEQPPSLFGVEADYLNDPMACWWAIGQLEERGWDYDLYGRALQQVRVRFYRGGTEAQGEGETFMLAFCRAVNRLDGKFLLTCHNKVC